MRYTLLTLTLSGLLCIGLGTAPALAQDSAATATQQDAPGFAPMHHGRGPMSPDDQLAHMTKALNLTTDQQGQIKPLLEARRQQMIQMHSDTSLSREDRMAKFKTLDDDTHSKIAAVLDDKQKEKFAKMAERREQHSEHHDGAPGGAPPESR